MDGGDRAVRGGRAFAGTVVVASPVVASTTSSSSSDDDGGGTPDDAKGRDHSSDALRGGVREERRPRAPRAEPASCAAPSSPSSPPPQPRSILVTRSARSWSAAGAGAAGPTHAQLASIWHAHGDRLDALDERRPSPDVTPLATPDVSKYGADDAWLFIRDNAAGASDDGGRGGSASGGGRMRRSSSVTFTEDENFEVHDIGSVRDLRREKGIKKSGSLSSLTEALAASFKHLSYKFSKKDEETKADNRVAKARLKQSRGFMCDNIDHARSMNGDKPAWVTREESVRGGTKLLRVASTPQLSESYATTSAPRGSGGADGGGGEERGSDGCDDDGEGAVVAVER